MAKYYVHCSNGFRAPLNAVTKLGAKREITRNYLRFGAGSVTLIDHENDDAYIASREFWQDLNRFGWNKWK